MNSHTKKNKEREILNFFQIQIEASLSDFTDLFTEVELEKIDLSKKIFVRNNESIITPENWEQHKETFFNQRIATYKNDYTFTEKIKLEVSKLKNLNTKINDYKVLKDRYNIFLEQKQPNIEPFQTLANPIEKQKPELNINQIALKYAYEDLQIITRKNGNEIAKKYGHNSGEKLFQKFTYFSSSANRKGKPHPFSLKKLDNKIRLIESIIEILPIDKQERAKDEVLILKTMYETE
jgi:flagellar capping protein FliD